MPNDPSRWQYLCPTCRQGQCSCDRTAARTARVYDVLYFRCAHCPGPWHEKEVFLSVNTLRHHTEDRHSRPLIPTVGATKGGTP